MASLLNPYSLAGGFAGLGQGLQTMAERRYQSERDEANFLREKALAKYKQGLLDQSASNKTGSGYFNATTGKELSVAEYNALPDKSQAIPGRQEQATQNSIQVEQAGKTASAQYQAQSEAKTAEEQQKIEAAWPSVARANGLDPNDEAAKKIWADMTYSDKYAAELNKSGIKPEQVDAIIARADKNWNDPNTDKDLWVAKATEALKQQYGGKIPKEAATEVENVAKQMFIVNEFNFQKGLLSSTSSAPLGQGPASEIRDKKMQEAINQKEALINNLVSSPSFDQAAKFILDETPKDKLPKMQQIIEEARQRKSEGVTQPSQQVTDTPQQPQSSLLTYKGEPAKPVINEAIKSMAHKVQPESLGNVPKIQGQEILPVLFELENSGKKGYKDGKWVPYKSTGKNTKMEEIGPGLEITKPEAAMIRAKGGLTDKELQNRVDKKLKEVKTAVDKSIKIPLPKKSKLAIYSLVWNVGIGTTKGKSKSGGWLDSNALKALNKGDFGTFAEEAFGEKGWNKINGEVSSSLKTRRQRERDLFFEGINESNGEYQVKQGLL